MVEILAICIVLLGLVLTWAVVSILRLRSDIDAWERQNFHLRTFCNKLRGSVLGDKPPLPLPGLCFCGAECYPHYHADPDYKHAKPTESGEHR